MRRSLVGLLFLAALLFVGAPIFANAQTAGMGIRYTGTPVVFTCASSGSAAQSIPAGTYRVIVQTEALNVCYAATCATGGIPYQNNTREWVTFDVATSVACNSTNGTGKLTYVKTIPW
jgi:hypothetical protein